MADGITLSTNIGTGAVLATEDESSVHYQKIKLTASGSGTTADLSHAEDTAHTTGDHGIMALGVRKDAAASLAGTDGDYTTAIFDSTGRLHANVSNTLTVAAHAVTNAGTFAVQEDGAALTALQVLDNYVYVDDADWTATTSSHALIGGIYQSSPGTITDGDTGPLRVDANGAIHISDGGSSITIDGTVTANLSATDNAVLDQIEVNTSYGEVVGGGAEATALRVTMANDSTGVLSIDDNGGSLTVDGTVTANAGSGTFTVDNGGTFAVQATLDAETTKVIGTVNVAAAQTIAVTNAGTFATQATLQTGSNAIGKLAANSGVDIGDVDILSLPASTNTIEVVGDVAHDAAAAGNPVLIGSRATADVEALTEVAEADASYVATDLQGVVITRPYIAAQEHVQYHVVNTAGTELAVTGLDAGGAGIHNYVTSIIVHNAHASTNGFIQLLDGSGGTPMMTIPAPATGGAVINLNQPLKQTTANTALYWDASAAITTLYVTIIGYQGQG